MLNMFYNHILNLWILLYIGFKKIYQKSAQGKNKLN